jgi:hypothetical protein
MRDQMVSKLAETFADLNLRWGAGGVIELAGACARHGLNYDSGHRGGI